MLSRTAEYALRAIVWLSDHPESSVTGQAIAAATQVPPDYLAKVMQGLVRAGLVEAQRGKNGGFSLVSTPEEITILDVINAVEPVRRSDRVRSENQRHHSSAFSWPRMSGGNPVASSASSRRAAVLVRSRFGLTLERIRFAKLIVLCVGLLQREGVLLGLDLRDQIVLQDGDFRAFDIAPSLGYGRLILRLGDRLLGALFLNLSVEVDDVSSSIGRRAQLLLGIEFDD